VLDRWLLNLSSSGLLHLLTGWLLALQSWGLLHLLTGLWCRRLL